MSVIRTPSLIDQDSRSGIIIKFLILVSNQRHHKMAAGISVVSFSEGHLVPPDESSGDFDGAVQPLINVVVVPWKVDEFISLKFVGGLLLARKFTIWRRSFFKAILWYSLCLKNSILAAKRKLKPATPTRALLEMVLIYIRLLPNWACFIWLLMKSIFIRF